MSKLETSASGNGKTRTIEVDYLARVEGEGAMYVKIVDQRVECVELKIFEPPRFFEAFLRGRRMAEAVDITARICGICPVAYQMSAAHAMEMACGIRVDGPLRDLRRLIYCGEWIESHGLHAFMLHLPDFLGYESAIEMAKDYPDEVNMALRLKKIGNSIVNLVGGREVHPINVRVGGFYRIPTKRELRALTGDLEWARDAAVRSVRLFQGLEFPEIEQDYEVVALQHPDEYPFNEGRLVSNKGLDIDVREFNEHFVEEHVERSNALHCVHRRRGAYHVGPIARYNLNQAQLQPTAREAAREAGLGAAVWNPYRSLIVRGVEMVHACEEALRIIAQYEMPDEPAVDVRPQAGEGHGCTEAPRGILYHRYRLDDDGIIRKAQIVPPTSQNQKQIEEDLRRFVERNQSLPDERLQWQCEQMIRNYDPCISCATHFLKLTIDRE
jgi:coenzyme F420-reducing hydrogenase alpha subunit